MLRANHILLTIKVNKYNALALMVAIKIERFWISIKLRKYASTRCCSNLLSQHYNIHTCACIIWVRAEHSVWLSAHRMWGWLNVGCGTFRESFSLLKRTRFKQICHAEFVQRIEWVLWTETTKAYTIECILSTCLCVCECECCCWECNTKWG